MQQAQLSDNSPPMKPTPCKTDPFQNFNGIASMQNPARLLRNDDKGNGRLRSNTLSEVCRALFLVIKGSSTDGRKGALRYVRVAWNEHNADQWFAPLSNALDPAVLAKTRSATLHTAMDALKTPEATMTGGARRAPHT